jgi:iron complex outermembrane recepter protein
MGTHPNTLAYLIAGLTGLGGLLSPALAAESNSIDKVDEHLVVIGRSDNTPLNIAANVTVIDSAEIEMSAATSLTELLRGQAGIQISDSNSGAVFALRGFSAEQAGNNTLILIDGRRLNNIDIAAPNIDAIPLERVERIEILSGSAAVLYGDQAVGGVINIITKAPSASGGSVKLTAGNFDTYGGQADIAGAINADWRYFLATGYEQADNYRRHNASEVGSALGRLQYQDVTDSFFIESSYLDNRRELAGALSLEELQQNPRQANDFNLNDYMHEISRVLRSGYQHALDDQWTLAADGNYADSQVSSVNWGFGGQNQRSLLELSPKIIAKLATSQGELSLVGGIDASRGESEFDWGRSNEQDMAAAYVQGTVPLTSSLSYVIGGRLAKVWDDLIDNTAYPEGVALEQDAHALEFGVNYRPSSTQRWYVRGEDNFRFAKVDEQAYTSPGVVGLKPQTGRSYEAGWDWTPGSHSLRLSLYRLELEDEIVFDPGAPKPDNGVFDGANVNADASRRHGAGLNWDWQLSQGVLLGGEYHYIDAEFTAGANRGKTLSWVAAHTGRGYVSLDFDSQWQLFAEAQYFGERFIGGDDANQAPLLDAYWLSNLALNYRRDAWLASLRLENALDEDYVSAGFFSQWGSGYYPGAGRALRLSASYRF